MIQMANSKMGGAVLLAALMAVAPQAMAQTKSVWDGVYSQAQADRGHAQYAQHCAMCHGAELEGNGEAPPLTGEFIPDWAGMPLADLHDKIRITMPLNAPGTLSPEVSSDILAYLLQRNNFPAGPGELSSAKDALSAISFDVSKPKPLPPTKKSKAK
jgi:mono/diheme cytochrome c family protein